MSSLLSPLFAYAQLGQPLGNVIEIVMGLQVVIGALIRVTFALAFLFFFWGLAIFILNVADEEKRKKGKSIMLGGLLALFIMATTLGIIDFIGQALGVGQGGSADSPHVEFVN